MCASAPMGGSGSSPLLAGHPLMGPAPGGVRSREAPPGRWRLRRRGGARPSGDRLLQLGMPDMLSSNLCSGGPALQPQVAPLHADDGGGPLAIAMPERPYFCHCPCSPALGRRGCIAPQTGRQPAPGIWMRGCGRWPAHVGRQVAHAARRPASRSCRGRSGLTQLVCGATVGSTTTSVGTGGATSLPSTHCAGLCVLDALVRGPIRDGGEPVGPGLVPGVERDGELVGGRREPGLSSSFLPYAPRWLSAWACRPTRRGERQRRRSRAPPEGYLLEEVRVLGGGDMSNIGAEGWPGWRAQSRHSDGPPVRGPHSTDDPW